MAGGEAGLRCSTAVQLLAEQPGQEPAEQAERGKGKPGEAWEAQPGRHMDQSKEKEQGKEKRGEKDPAVRAGGPPSALPPLEGLRALQLDMQPVNSHAGKAFARFRPKQRQKRKPHLECRSHLIQGIPGFWGTTVSFCFSGQTAAGGWARGGHGREEGGCGHPSRRFSSRSGNRTGRIRDPQATLLESCLGSWAESLPEPVYGTKAGPARLRQPPHLHPEEHRGVPRREG